MEFRFSLVTLFHPASVRRIQLPHACTMQEPSGLRRSHLDKQLRPNLAMQDGEFFVGLRFTTLIFRCSKPSSSAKGRLYNCAVRSSTFSILLSSRLRSTQRWTRLRLQLPVR